MIAALLARFRRRRPAPKMKVDEAGIAAAVAADRARCLEILKSAEAVGQEELARILAHESHVDIATACRILRVAGGNAPDISSEARARCGRILPDDDPDLAPAHAARNEERPPH